MSIRGKVDQFTLDDLIMLAQTADIKKKTAQGIIKDIIEVVSCFRQRAEALDIREDLITLVQKSLRIDI
jgi:hypothetical protein